MGDKNCNQLNIVVNFYVALIALFSRCYIVVFVVVQDVTQLFYNMLHIVCFLGLFLLSSLLTERDCDDEIIRCF